MYLEEKLGGNMTKVILIAHGNLAYEMKRSSQMIMGKVEGVTPIAFYENEGLEDLIKKIENTFNNKYSSYLIISDIFAGTPYNAACAIQMKHSHRKISVISGMSLPMVLEAISASQYKQSVELIKDIMISINDSIKVFELDEIEKDDLI